jgi:glycine amidinotransferase
MPLAPGTVLVNRDRLPALPRVLRDWKPIYAPEPAMPASHPLYMSSRWLSVNVLSLDPKRVFVEAGELPLAETLSRHGFEPILAPFRWVNSFGGGFHCVTLDVRRRCN